MHDMEKSERERELDDKGLQEMGTNTVNKFFHSCAKCTYEAIFSAAWVIIIRLGNLI